MKDFEFAVYCSLYNVEKKTIEVWWWWWRENNRNIVVVVYSFTIHEAVKKKKLSLGSMWGPFGVDVFVDGKICRINEEVEEEEGNQG